MLSCWSNYAGYVFDFIAGPRRVTRSSFPSEGLYWELLIRLLYHYGPMIQITSVIYNLTPYVDIVSIEVISLFCGYNPTYDVGRVPVSNDTPNGSVRHRSDRSHLLDTVPTIPTCWTPLLSLVSSR